MSDDYTQTLWSVMARERVYSQPLEVEERRHLFGEWLDANPDAVSMMEGWALEIMESGEPVAVQRLFERMRWEGARVEAVPYTDFNGKRHEYRLNHNDRALFGRWLQSRHPEMRVTQRRSMFDGVVYA